MLKEKRAPPLCQFLEGLVPTQKNYLLLELLHFRFFLEYPKKGARIQYIIIYIMNKS